MIAKLSRTGLSPNDAAIAGSEVASTVESRFSMNRAQATISGISTGAEHSLGRGATGSRKTCAACG